MIKLNGVALENTQFPNGELMLDKFIKNLLTEDVNEISYKYTGDKSLLELYFVKKYLDQISLKPSHLTITYMPYSRMDRSENESPFTLKYVSDLINSLEFDVVKIIEPHSDVTPALLNRSKSFYANFDYLSTLVNDSIINPEKDYIVFPDSGASKRYSKMKYPNILIGHKERDFQTGQIHNLQIIGDLKQDPETAIIVDDLSSYGGTFVHTSKKLREIGFQKIYLLVCHTEDNIFKGELFDHIDHLYTTDSLLTNLFDSHNQKFKDKITVMEVF